LAETANIAIIQVCLLATADAEVLETKTLPQWEVVAQKLEVHGIRRKGVISL